MQPSQPNRRTFLTKSVTGAAAIAAGISSVDPQRVLGANERINIGVIGCGGRGTHLSKIIHTLAEECNVEIVSVCDVWKRQLESISSLVEQRQGTKPATCQRYGDVLNNKDVDAVIIATPDFAHSRILTEAAYAGKHAYCEKPMSNNLRDANAAADAVDASGIICQVGVQRRSHNPHYEAMDVLRSGVLGVIIEVESCYNRCTPSWARDASGIREEDVDWEQYLMYLPKRRFDAHRYRSWHLYRDYTIGLAGLLGVHVYDVGPWFMDDPIPETAMGMGGTLVWKEGREHYDTLESSFMFPRGFMLRFVSRLGNAAGGAEAQIRGTKGTFDSGTLTFSGEGGGKEAIKEPIKIDQEGVPAWSDARPHVKNWLECIRSGKKPNADVHAGYSHSVISIMAHLAADQGTQVHFDRERRRIV